MSLNDGLIWASHFNNGTATDWIGGNDGTVNGAIATTDKNGENNKALSFDGIDYVSISASNLQSISGSFSVSIWINTTSYTFHDTPIGRGTWGNSGAWMLRLLSGGSVTFELYGSGTNQVEASTSIQDGNWHHVVGTFDSSDNSMKIYIDGKLENSVTHTNGNAAYAANTFLGMRNGSDRPYIGSIDEPRVYNRALTDFEILKLYYGYDTENGTVNTLVEGCEAYYKFDGNATDATGNGNDGTVNGATLTTGKINQGYSFDGTNDYIRISKSNTDYQELSFSGWYKFDELTGRYTFFGLTGLDAGNENQLSYRADINQFFLTFRDNDGDAPPFADALISYSSSNFNTSDFFHIVIIGSVTQDFVKVYVNSVLVGTINNYFSNYNMNEIDTADIWIGVDDQSGQGEGDFFKGKIDELAIWNRALSQDEINYLYANGNPTEAQQYPFTTPQLIKQNPLFMGASL